MLDQTALNTTVPLGEGPSCPWQSGIQHQRGQTLIFGVLTLPLLPK